MTTTLTASKRLRRSSTPQLLRIGLCGTWAASLLLLLSAITAIQTQRNNIRAVTENAIPNVIQAQRLKTAMTDIDSMVANQMLTASTTPTKFEQEYFNERRNDLAERIVLASQNISQGEAERLVLEKIVLNFNDYIAQVERARVAKEQGNEIALLAAYRKATQILDETLLPNADELAQVNTTALEQRYQAAQSEAQRSRVLLVLSGVLLIGSLIGLQFFLSRRTRRTINPMLLGATVLTALFLAYTLALMSTSESLRLLKEDAYGSLRALRLGRVLLYQANGAKSRYLLDRVLSTQHETAFYQHTNQVLKLPDGTSLEAVMETYRNGGQVPGLTGYFADALNQISIPGEREVLVSMLENHIQYLSIDRRIRQLNTSDQKQAAIDLSTGQNSGQSYWAFDQLRDVNEQAVDINTAWMKQITENTLNSLSEFEFKAAASMTAVAFLILLGIRPRLREYFA